MVSALARSEGTVVMAVTRRRRSGPEVLHLQHPRLEVACLPNRRPFFFSQGMQRHPPGWKSCFLEFPILPEVFLSPVLVSISFPHVIPTPEKHNFSALLPTSLNRLDISFPNWGSFHVPLCIWEVEFGGD